MKPISFYFTALLLWLLLRGEAISQLEKPLPQSEVRGVWVTPQFFGTGQDTALRNIRATLDEYEAAGINTVMILVKSTGGLVYFQSSSGVRDTAFRWDFFGTFLEEARKRHLSVHPWFCIFTESALAGEVRAHPEWLIRGRKGELLPVVNPALQEVRHYEITLMKELVERYNVDWVHLDYVRFPCEPTEMYFSFDAETRALFKARAGEDPILMKSMDTGNVMWNAWIEWNADQVTTFLRELRKALSETGRAVKISAAVFPDAANARVAIGQDWGAWPDEGLVDMLCPMLYTNNDELFETYSRRALDVARGRSAVCAGIGIGTAHNQNTPQGVLRQVAIARRLALQGFVLFSSSSFKEEFIARLRRSN
jgi:uncharacterized lipoprotein YddW (UPF0748 family)